MGYGGIRGAIAFSLVTILCSNRIPGLPILFTTTIMVVMFTIFVQVRFYVTLLEYKTKEFFKLRVFEFVMTVNDCS